MISYFPATNEPCGEIFPVVLQAKRYEVTRVCCVDMFSGRQCRDGYLSIERRLKKSSGLSFFLEDMDALSSKMEQLICRLQGYILEHSVSKFNSLYLTD